MPVASMEPPALSLEGAHRLRQEVGLLLVGLPPLHDRSADGEDQRGRVQEAEGTKDGELASSRIGHAGEDDAVCPLALMANRPPAIFAQRRQALVEELL